MIARSPIVALVLVAFSAALLSACGGTGTSAAASSRSTRLWSCAHDGVTKPKSFTITCADANTLIEHTTWTSWGSTRAAGATTFGDNFCLPNCASSKMSYFSHSSVTLSAPKASAHGELFSKLTVRYLRDGKKRTYSFSFASLPVFST